MHNLFVLFLLLLGSFICALPAHAACTLEVSAVDTFGQKYYVAGQRVEFLNVMSQIKHVAEIPDSQQIEIECGTYNVSLLISAFSVPTQKITLPGADGSSKQKLIFGLKLYASGDRRNPHLLLQSSGLSPRDKSDLLYVLLPLFAGDTAVQPVSANGGVVFHFVSPGRYMLLAEKSGQIVFIEDIGEVTNNYRSSVRTKTGVIISLNSVSSELSGDVTIRK